MKVVNNKVCVKLSKNQVSVKLKPLEAYNKMQCYCVRPRSPTNLWLCWHIPQELELLPTVQPLRKSGFLSPWVTSYFEP